MLISHAIAPFEFPPHAPIRNMTITDHSATRKTINQVLKKYNTGNIE